MSGKYGEKELPEYKEHLLASDIVRMLSKEGVSYGKASKILEEAQEELKKVPLTEC